MARFFVLELLFWRSMFLIVLSLISINYMLMKANENSSTAGKNKLYSQKLSISERIEEAMNEKQISQLVEIESNRRKESMGGEEYENELRKLSLKSPNWANLQYEPALRSRALKVGKWRSNSAFLVIGIPTVYRDGAFYLIDTLKSLVTNLPPENWNEVVIVVFVSDFQIGFLKSVIDDINSMFFEELQAGLIQVMRAISSFYPDMRNLPLLYGDKKERVRWRSKQSLDYSFLFYYCANLGKYYIQLEDDVIAIPNYFWFIKEHVKSKRNNWSIIEFGSRGFIGMMYRSEHLVVLSKFVRMNYWTMPVDWTFRFFNEIFLHGNSKANKVKPPLFKHIGKKSSLVGQVRLLEDLKHDLVEPGMYELKKNNPQATLTTTIIECAEGHDITKAYSSLTDFFWGRSVAEGDTIDINIDTAALLKRIVISSGVQQHPDDSLKDWELLAATDHFCETFRSLSSFTDTRHISFEIPPSLPEIKCIRLKITGARKNKAGGNNWLIIPQIAVVI